MANLMSPIILFTLSFANILEAIVERLMMLIEAKHQ